MHASAGRAAASLTPLKVEIRRECADTATSRGRVVDFDAIDVDAAA